MQRDVLRSIKKPLSVISFEALSCINKSRCAPTYYGFYSLVCPIILQKDAIRCDFCAASKHSKKGKNIEKKSIFVCFCTYLSHITDIFVPKSELKLRQKSLRQNHNLLIIRLLDKPIDNKSSQISASQLVLKVPPNSSPYLYILYILLIINKL